MLQQVSELRKLKGKKNSWKIMFYFLIWLSKCKAALFEVDIIGKNLV